MSLSLFRLENDKIERQNKTKNYKNIIKELRKTSEIILALQFEFEFYNRRIWESD